MEDGREPMRWYDYMMTAWKRRALKDIQKYEAENCPEYKAYCIAFDRGRCLTVRNIGCYFADAVEFGSSHMY